LIEVKTRIFSYSKPIPPLREDFFLIIEYRKEGYLDYGKIVPFLGSERTILKIRRDFHAILRRHMRMEIAKS